MIVLYYIGITTVGMLRAMKLYFIRAFGAFMNIYGRTYKVKQNTDSSALVYYIF